MNQIQRNRICRIQTISWKSYSTINLWEDHVLGIDHIRKIINRASVRSFDHHILFTKWKSHRYFVISRFENHMKVNKLQCFMRVSEYHFRSAVKNSSLQSHELCHHRTLHKFAFWVDVPSPEMIRYCNKIKYVSPVIPAERWTESVIDRHLSSMKIWEKKLDAWNSEDFAIHENDRSSDILVERVFICKLNSREIQMIDTYSMSFSQWIVYFHILNITSIFASWSSNFPESKI